ncbi:MAG: GTPase HflX, partial [Rhodospirillales bacterium]|nr:GTPase HflX [Rhodospirillales bacterium]
QGIDALLKTIDVALSSSRETLTVKIPVEDGRTLSWLYSHGDVSGRTDDEKLISLTVRLDPDDAARLRKQAELNPAIGLAD